MEVNDMSEKEEESGDTPPKFPIGFVNPNDFRLAYSRSGGYHLNGDVILCSRGGIKSKKMEESYGIPQALISINSRLVGYCLTGDSIPMTGGKNETHSQVCNKMCNNMAINAVYYNN